ncbi:MAG: aldo/keto reductase [Firmicutes bacterium]|nr:aldo/keto reductase [Bacillota bacterium]
MEMKKLGFGCMRMPITNKEDRTSFDVPHVEKMVDTFLENGFTYFDTAYMYHSNASETILKEVLVKRHPRESFLLADKMPVFFLKEKAELEKYFDEQLEKTGAGYFDYYLLHGLSGSDIPMVRDFDIFGFCEQKKQEGKIRHLGFSFHDDAETLDRILTEFPQAEFVQLQINYLDWDNYRIQSRKCYEVARKHDKPVVIMEPVKGGTLAAVPDEAAKLFQDLQPGMSPASWAIRFAAGLEGVMVVLSGMSNIEQMEDNISFMKEFQPLTEEEKNTVFQAAEIIRASQIIPCTECRYCTDGCPVSIPIPDIFRVCNAEYKSTGSTETYADVTKDTGKAKDCLACGQCESMCPQHIGIIAELKKASEMFE